MENCWEARWHFCPPRRGTIPSFAEAHSLCLFVNMQVTTRQQDLPAPFSITTWRHAWLSQVKCQGKEQTGPNQPFNQDHTWLVAGPWVGFLCVQYQVPTPQTSSPGSGSGRGKHRCCSESLWVEDGLWKGPWGRAGNETTLFKSAVSQNTLSPPIHSEHSSSSFFETQEGSLFCSTFHSFCAEL